MRVLDRVANKASQVDDYNYTLSSLAGWDGVPEGKDRCLVAFRDRTGASLTVLGERTGDNFQLQEIIPTSADTFIPTFDNDSLELFSVSGQAVLDKVQGVAGVLYIGQSDGTSWNTGQGNIPLIDNDDPRLKQYVYDIAATNAGLDEGIYQLQEPIHHPILSESGSATVSSAKNFGKSVVADGWNEFCILPACVNAVGYASFTPTEKWGVGQPSHERAKALGVKFLEEGYNHKIFCIVRFLGQTDALAGTSAASYQAKAIAEAQDFRDAFTLASGIDHSRTPIVNVGMNEDFLTGGHRLVIEAVNADLVNLIPNYSYLNLVGNSVSTDGTHSDDITQRWIGSQLLAKRNEAAANFVPVNTLNLSATTPEVDVNGNDATLETTAASDPLELEAATAPESTADTPDATLETTPGGNYAYYNAGPVTVTPSSPLDSLNSTVTQAVFDLFSLRFKANFDTEWSLGWIYWPNDYSGSGQLLRLRMQPGGGNLNFQLDEKDAEGLFEEVFTGTTPYTIGNTIDLGVARDENNLVTLSTGETTIVSGSHVNPIPVVEGILHFGNTTEGAELVLTDIELSAPQPVINLEAATAPESTVDTPDATLETTTVVVSTRPLTVAIPGEAMGYYAGEGLTTDASGNVIGWEDFFGNQDMTFVGNTNQNITVGPLGGIACSGVTGSGRIAGDAVNGAANTVIIGFKGTDGYPFARYYSAIGIGPSAANQKVYLGAASPAADLTGANLSNDDVHHTVAVAKSATDFLVERDGVEIVNTSHSTAAGEAGTVFIGQTSFGNHFVGEIDFVYLNKGHALTSQQIADVLSERVI